MRDLEAIKTINSNPPRGRTSLWHVVPDWKRNSNLYQHKQRCRLEWARYQLYLAENNLDWHRGDGEPE
jgi:hypothetical protein